jgi:hypothetical protein
MTAISTPTAQVSGEDLTAQIDATSGVVVAAPLANNSVWAGFPSVNQVNPRLISFAGQFKAQSNYYNELLNYTWVTNLSTRPPIVAPMDREAPCRTRLSTRIPGARRLVVAGRQLVRL